MKIFLKNILISNVIKIAALFNIDINIVIARKSKKTDFSSVDRNELESFYNNDNSNVLYKEGLKQSGMEHTDHFLNIYESLINYILFVHTHHISGQETATSRPFAQREGQTYQTYQT